MAKSTTSERCPTACLNCHQKKLKCSGGRPCERCIKKGIPCTEYQPRRRKATQGIPLKKDIQKSKQQALPDITELLSSFPEPTFTEEFCQGNLNLDSNIEWFCENWETLLDIPCSALEEPFVNIVEEPLPQEVEVATWYQPEDWSQFLNLELLQ